MSIEVSRELKEISQENGYSGFLFLGFSNGEVKVVGDIPWPSVALTLLKYAPSLSKYAPSIVELIQKLKHE